MNFKNILKTIQEKKRQNSVILLKEKKIENKGLKQAINESVEKEQYYIDEISLLKAELRTAKILKTRYENQNNSLKLEIKMLENKIKDLEQCVMGGNNE